MIESLGTEPITKIAKELGGWPLIEGEAWNADNSWTWQEQVKKFRTAGFSMDYIIDFSIGVDLQNSTKRIMDVSWDISLDIVFGLIFSITFVNCSWINPRLH